MSDERKSLPSASAASRYAQCPGSFLLGLTVPEPPSSPDAEAGTRIHAYIAGDHSVTLSADESNTAAVCRSQAAQIASEHGFPREPDIREQRLWAKFDGEPAWSGQPDEVYLEPGRALVIDYKTGRGEVESAEGNLQLRALAVLVDEHYGPLDEIIVAIVQPLAGKPTVCRYSSDDLLRASFEIEEIMHGATRPDQPLRPSPDACKYCRAKEVCTVAHKVVETLPALVQRDGREIAMTPEQVGRFLVAAKVAEAVIDSVRGKAKRMLEDGTPIPGWTLKPGTERETISQPEVVFGRFVRAGGTQDQFMGTVSIGKSKLKEAVRAATGAKGKALDDTMRDLLEGCVETKTTAPSLVEEGTR